jgi:hypothetical protein
MSKEEFIANYLNKSRRLKNHNLPYGMEYLNLVSKVEEDAEKHWKKHIKKNKTNTLFTNNLNK